MTTVFQPLQRQSDKRWDYTRGSGSSGPYPIGYCAGWKYDKYLESAQDDINKQLLEEEMQARLPFKEKYHSDGHATAEEAEHCHDTYLLDTALGFFKNDNEQHRCAVCGNWGQHHALIRGDSHHGHWLCDEHANRDAYEPIFRRRYYSKRT